MSAKESWNEVGNEWTGFGLQLYSRYRAQRDAREAFTPAPRTLGDRVGDAFRSLQDLVQDPEVTGSLDRAVRATGEAISTTVDEAAEEVRHFLERRGDAGGTSPSSS